MEYTELGATGRDVSVLGLGAGGSSRLGIDAGEEHARRVVEAALEHGVTVVDTAEAYGTESVVGRVVSSVPREDVFLSTKCSVYDDDGDLRPPTAVEESLAGSLDRLGTDHVDAYHLHGVAPEDYKYARETLGSELARLREEGRVRFAGITETVSGDPGHEMLSRAVTDDLWDVVMVGFNLLNHSARERVLEPAAERGIGTIAMVPVRRALADPAALESVVGDLVETGEVDPAQVDTADPFGFLIHEAGASDLFDAAYRFCRHEPTVDTVLTGTGSRDHLAANVESALSGPLPEADLERLRERFGDVDSVIGN